MPQQEPQSINSVAKKLRLSVHQLRRWELLFGLEIKRGKGQQRQYRPQDLRVLERIKELTDQGWPTTQISQQLETEGLMAPKLIGLPTSGRNSEALTESIIGVRSFCERRLTEIGQQLNEIQQILMSFSLKQQISDATYSPWQPVTSDLPGVVRENPVTLQPEDLDFSPVEKMEKNEPQSDTVQIPAPNFAMPEITDQNYLTVLGKTLDLVGWSDSQADTYSMKNYRVSVWIDLGRSDAEKFIGFLRSVSANKETPGETIQINEPDAADSGETKAIGIDSDPTKSPETEAIETETVEEALSISMLSKGLGATIDL